jgi:hypothetical protein
LKVILNELEDIFAYFLELALNYELWILETLFLSESSSLDGNLFNFWWIMLFYSYRYLTLLEDFCHDFSFKLKSWDLINSKVLK